MVYIYLAFCILCIVISVRIYNKYLNPVSVYSAIWFLDMLLYNIGLVQFEKISYKTVLVIFIAHIVYLCGCLFGKYISCIKIASLFIEREESQKEMLLRKHMLFYSGLSAISIMSEFFSFIISNGFAFFSATQSQYLNELYAKDTNEMSFGALIYVAITLSSIYLNQYGIKKEAFFPIVLMIMDQMLSGSRGGFVCAILLFLAPFLLNKRKVGVTKEIRKRKKVLFLVLLAGVVLLAIITSARSKNGSMPYASDILKDIPGVGYLLYVLIVYFSSGIGCLNQYMKNPLINEYPKLFFRVPLIVTNKFGLTNLDVEYRGITYYTPIQSNVLTMIGELYHDFGMLFVIVFFILATIFAKSYCDSINNKKITSQILFSSLFVIFSLSFFCYFGRLANLWYVVFFGILAAIIVDYKIFIWKRT